MQLGEKKLIVQRASVGAKQNMNNVSATLVNVKAMLHIIIELAYEIYEHAMLSYTVFTTK